LKEEHPIMATDKKPPYVATVALTMTFPEARYVRDGEPLEIEVKGSGSSVPIAISRAVRLAFKNPGIERKSPTYLNMSVTVLSRWLLHDVASPRFQ
jgi:hypothetical protein